jgi:hypothetical protein
VDTEVVGVKIDGSGDFAVIANTCENEILRPGSSCSLTIRFRPSRTGHIEGSVHIFGAAECIVRSDAPNACVKDPPATAESTLPDPDASTSPSATSTTVGIVFRLGTVRFELWPWSLQGTGY